MWGDVLNKPKQVNIFREFRGDLIIVDSGYDKKLERRNNSDRIAGVISEELNGLNPVKKIL